MTDAEIDQLLKMPKTVKNPGARSKKQKGSDQINYEVVSDSGEQFRLIKRQNLRVEDDFSCGLLYVKENGETVMLARYNGSSHVHRNPLGDAPDSHMQCHIHRATERYIAAGRKAEHFAEPTDRYSDVEGAFSAILSDCKISGLRPAQLSLLK